MHCRIILNAVVLESVTICELFEGEDKALLSWWDSFLVLDLDLYILNAISWLNVQCDVFVEGFDKNLHLRNDVSLASDEISHR